MACPCYAVLGDNRHHSIMGAGRCAAPCVADAAPILTALDASVVIVGTSGQRAVPMKDFYIWSGQTVVKAEEIILEIHVPRRQERSAQVFEKSAGWDGDFADASVAVQLSFEGTAITAASISLGAVAPLPVRAVATEEAILDGDLSDTHIRVAAEKAVRGALPLSGNRYKTDLLVNLTERAIQRCLSEEGVA